MNCPVTPDLNAICLAASRAVGGGALAVDLLEDPDRGLLVNEVNHTMEFHSSAPATGVDIPGRVIDYALSVAQGISTSIEYTPSPFYTQVSELPLQGSPRPLL
jgi:glutathione synthase/RimK-type ligase-like ATP-grasp enzyme